MLHDPHVLEFLGIEQRVMYGESELEQGLINHLEAFMRELGRAFCFVGHQQRITVCARKGNRPPSGPAAISTAK